MDPIQGARRAANGAWMERAARAGMVARGVLYAIIGTSALLLSVGEGGGLLDSAQAAKQVQRQSYGDALLFALGIGLACYGLWRFAQGALGHGQPGDDRRKVAIKRVASAVSGLVHLAFAVSAFQAATGNGGGGRSSWVHRVLAWDGGRWVVIAIGAGFVGFGLHQLYRAFTAKFRKELDTGAMSATEERWAIRIGRFGMAARGVVLPIVGWMLIRAGREADAAEAKGTGAALREIATSAWGEILLPVVAAGFISYALYQFVRARYHADLMRA
jgi:hypothetical protein